VSAADISSWLNGSSQDLILEFAKVTVDIESGVPIKHPIHVHQNRIGLISDSSREYVLKHVKSPMVPTSSNVLAELLNIGKEPQEPKKSIIESELLLFEFDYQKMHLSRVETEFSLLNCTISSIDTFRFVLYSKNSNAITLCSTSVANDKIIQKVQVNLPEPQFKIIDATFDSKVDLLTVIAMKRLNHGPISVSTKINCELKGFQYRIKPHAPSKNRIQESLSNSEIQRELREIQARQVQIESKLDYIISLLSS
jgi:hypothetical protein